MLGIFNLTERLAKECMVLVTSKVLSLGDELPVKGAWAGSRDCRTYHALLYGILYKPLSYFLILCIA